MTRSTRRHSGIQTPGTIATDKAPSLSNESSLSEALPPMEAPAALSYWRLAMFLWGVSFVSLFAYELLSAILKTW